MTAAAVSHTSLRFGSLTQRDQKFPLDSCAAGPMAAGRHSFFALASVRRAISSAR